jgi:hypothetical protein
MNSSNEVNLQDFINKMEEGISRRASYDGTIIGETEADSVRDTVSDWINTETERQVTIPNNEDILNDLI